MLLRVKPEYFDNVCALVLDEGHIIGDVSTRASLTEFLLIRLRIKIHNLRILFISAVMPKHNTDQYSQWLNNSRNSLIRSTLFKGQDEIEWEPTRKLIGKFEWDSKFENGRIVFPEAKYIDGSSNKEAFVPRILRVKEFANKFPSSKTKQRGKGWGQDVNKAETAFCLATNLLLKDSLNSSNCLIFCAKASEVNELAKKILTIMDKSPEINGINFYKKQDTESFHQACLWFGSENPITKCAERGIGLHFGDMPSSLRKSVENDYRSSKFRLLIATNTITQGLNLPIKYLIIRSTLQGKSNCVEVRDFWNIIGRAGRAGKETEGQIIYLINSDADKKSWNKYVKKENIEPAESIVFQILQWLIQRRCTQENYYNKLTLVSETYLLDMLLEEASETDDQEIIERIIKNSLFRVQCEDNQLNVQALKQSFKAIATNIRSKVPKELIPIYKKTGLSIKSNKNIFDFIENNIEELKRIIETDNYIDLLKMSMSLLDLRESYIIEIKDDEKLKKLKIQYLLFLPILKKWISGGSIDDLKEEWKNISNEDGIDPKKRREVKRDSILIQNHLGINKKEKNVFYFC